MNIKNPPFYAVKSSDIVEMFPLLDQCFANYVDECHQLVTDAEFREKMTPPMDEFFRFQRKALISATPILMSDPRFAEQSFRMIDVETEYDVRQPISVMHTYNLLQAIIETLIGKEGTITLFVNSISLIYSIIDSMKWTEESSVFCSKGACNELNKSYNFEHCFDQWKPERMSRYNFFTSRFYAAFDLELEERPHVIILTDMLHTPHTLVDPETSCIQICGRFRNGLTSVTHIYRTNPDIVCKTREQADWELSTLRYGYHADYVNYISAENEQVKFYLGETLKTHPFAPFVNDDGSINYFKWDHEVYKTVVTNLYSSRHLLEEAYTRSHYFEPTFVHCRYDKEAERLTLIRNTDSLKKRRALCLELLMQIGQSESEYDQQFVNQIREEDSFIVEAYEVLGADTLNKLKLNERKICTEMILKRQTGNRVIQLIKNEFVEGHTYSNPYIVKKLQEIYDRLGIPVAKKLQPKQILLYFQAIPSYVKKNRGYKLVRAIV
ncbi:MAG: hypothetical protein IJ494_07490 [Bacteroides sp.]|nr:hypothetical protein [Bacteroides sp.]